MNRALSLIAILVLSGSWMLAQGRPPAPADAQQLEKVLDSMDRAAARFRSAQPTFVADQYEAVVNVHTIQKGVMYIRKEAGGAIRMKVNITSPSPGEEVLFADDKVQLYQPAIDQLTIYSAGKNPEAFQSFLALGFGGGGRSLRDQFELRYAGSEKVGDVNTNKLELVPKSERVHSMFEKIDLWIDAGGISVQQKFFEPVSGNYRQVVYSNPRINEKIPDSAFQLKTTRKTKKIMP